MKRFSRNVAVKNKTQVLFVTFFDKCNSIQSETRQHVVFSCRRAKVYRLGLSTKDSSDKGSRAVVLDISLWTSSWWNKLNHSEAKGK